MRPAKLTLRVVSADRQDAQYWWNIAADCCRRRRCRLTLRYVRVEAAKTLWEGEVEKMSRAATPRPTCTGQAEMRNVRLAT